jgi:hypothetical protein
MNAIFIEKMCRGGQVCEAKERWYIVRLAHVVSNVKERKHAPNNVNVHVNNDERKDSIKGKGNGKQGRIHL